MPKLKRSSEAKAKTYIAIEQVRMPAQVGITVLKGHCLA